MMEINQAIVSLGADAVRRYSALAGILQDNEVPEVFLGGYIAGALHEQLKFNVHVERYYTVIAAERGAALNTEVINDIGDYRADIAIYQKKMPTAIVELKVFDDGKSAALIVADRDKMRKLSSRCGIESYLGVLVTDDKRFACTDRARKLESYLEQKFDLIGEPQPSSDNSWNWLFACGRFDRNKI